MLNPNRDNNNPIANILTVIAVWQKASTIPGCDPQEWRRDSCGYAIRYQDYGNVKSIYGWEISQTDSLTRINDSSIDNLQPLQWQNNRRMKAV